MAVLSYDGLESHSCRPVQRIKKVAAKQARQYSNLKLKTTRAAVTKDKRARQWPTVEFPWPNFPVVVEFRKSKLATAAFKIRFSSATMVLYG